MQFTIFCKKCGGKMLADSAWDGKAGKCPHCGNSLEIAAPHERDAEFQTSKSQPNTIKVYCPCGAKWRVKRSRVGLTGACWECGKHIKVLDPYAPAAQQQKTRGFTIECPECKKAFSARPEWAGQIGQCPYCAKAFKIPEKADLPATARGKALSSEEIAKLKEESSHLKVDVSKLGAKDDDTKEIGIHEAPKSDSSFAELKLDDFRQALGKIEEKSQAPSATPDLLITSESDELSKMLTSEDFDSRDLQLDIEPDSDMNIKVQSEPAAEQPTLETPDADSDDPSSFSIKLTITCKKCKTDNEVNIDELGEARCRKCKSMLEE